MLFQNFVAVFVFGGLASAGPSSRPRRDAASILPLSTKGRDIVDVNGNVFHFASTNWYGFVSIHLDEIKY